MWVENFCFHPSNIFSLGSDPVSAWRGLPACEGRLLGPGASAVPSDPVTGALSHVSAFTLSVSLFLASQTIDPIVLYTVPARKFQVSHWLEYRATKELRGKAFWILIAFSPLGQKFPMDMLYRNNSSCISRCKILKFLSQANIIKGC